MADKDIKSKTTAKSAPSAAKPKSTDKAAASAKAKSTAKPATEPKTKSAADTEQKTAAKTSAAKADTKEKSSASKTAANKPAAEKPKTENKPAAKSANDASKSKATGKAEEPVKTASKATAPAAAKINEQEAETKKTAKKSENKSETVPAESEAKKAKAKTDEATVKEDGKKDKSKSDPAKKESKKSAEQNKKTSNSDDKTASKKKKKLSVIISAVAIVLMAGIITGIVVGTKSSDGGPQFVPYEKVGVGEEHLFPQDQLKTFEYDLDKTTNTAVGYYGQQIGTVDRIIPQTTRNEGRVDQDKYPKYGFTPKGVLGTAPEQQAIRDTLIDESSYLTATGTSNAGGGKYIWMDKDGFLYNGTTAAPDPSLDSFNQHRRLYKHTCADGLYYGNVSPEEPGIIKTVTMLPRGYNGYGVTGVYAPAGEVIKIQISEADMNATGGITIHIGQALFNGQANNIWTAKNQMQRIPHVLNTMSVNKNTATLENGVYTAYVGSFIGGPLYIRNTGAKFTATITGGVAYSHFILGYTSEEEFEQNKNSSAPYFDLEVWNYGVLHSGPKHYANRYSYDDIYKAAVFWDKVSSVTTTGASQGIVFIYDAFVAAGAAVAFPGRRSVNCPADWMANSLNYNGLVTSGGWGNLHEYHHNFQGYGVGNGGEVTNNGMTLVSYSLFTKISSNRGILNYGAQNLGGWNSYTSATWALDQVLKIAKPDQNPSNGKQGLALYATLLHNFGQDCYIKAKTSQSGGQMYQTYFAAWQNVTHNDMSYYFCDILQGLDPKKAAELNANIDYPMFVPVSSVYQTGRSYMYDGEKKYITTMQPYVIPFGKEFTIDLNPYTVEDGMYTGGSIVLPDGFTYTVKKITQPANGSVTAKGDGLYTYMPDKNSSALRSGKIIVTLGIEKTDHAFEVEDVDLVLEFELSHETNKATLERTTYTFDAEHMYADAQTAYENAYQGFVNKQTIDHTNPTQNCNTDIWYYPDTQAFRDKYPNAPEHYFMPQNSVVELSGKLYVENEGKYRLYLRGRNNCALYYSLDGGETYTLGATIKDTTIAANSAYFRPNDPSTYVDLDLPAHSWVHIKEVLVNQMINSSQTSFIGVGLAQWTTPMFTIQEITDEDGNVIETKYFDYQGNEVSEEEANNAQLIPPVVDNNHQPYVNAYRSTYEFPSNAGFETDYFYTRKYNYSFTQSAATLPDIKIVDSSACSKDYPITNLIDGNPNTFCSSNDVVSASSPWEVTVDLGGVIVASRFELTGNMFNNNAGKNQTPNSITLFVGETLEDLQEVTSFDNGAVSGINLAFNFEKRSFRYYKLVVRKTVEGRFMCIRNIQFSSMADRYTPDDDMFDFSDGWTGVSALSTFGHVYLGKQNDTLTFEFTGTNFGIISSNEFGKNFEVYIDGKKAESVALSESAGYTGLSYLSQAMDSGTHTVTIKCTGEANIDSIAVFK